MIIEDKLNNVREALNKYDYNGVFEKMILESILDIIQDIICEIKELNEIIKV